MSLNPNGEIVLPLRLDDGPMQADFERAEQLARRSGASTANAYSEQASGGLSKLTRAMTDFRREQSQEARTARYFVSEFGSFIPVGTKAHDVVLSLTGALAGGLGLGIAIEAVTLGIKWYVDALRESEKAAEEAAKKQAEAAKLIAESWKAALEEVSRERAIAAGANEAVYDAERAADEKIAEVGQRLVTAEQTRAAARKRIREAEATAWRTSSAEIIVSARAEVAALDAEIAKLKETLAMRAEAGALAVDRAVAGSKPKPTKRDEAARQAADDAARVPYGAKDMAAMLRAQYQDAEAAKKGQAGLDAAARKYERAQYEEGLRAAQDYQRMLLAGWDEATYERLTQIDREEEQKLAALTTWYDAGLMAEEDFQAQRTAITEGAAEKRIKAASKETDALGEVSKMGSDAAKQALNVVGTAIEKQLNTSRRYEQALRKVAATEKESAQERRNAVYAELQAILAAMAKEATIRALMETAYGVAAIFTKPEAAANHFASAAIFGAAAVAAGAGASAIGNNRGMTAQERQSVASAAGGGESFSGSSPREVAPGGMTERTTREVVIVIGDPFETAQETARRAQRRLALANDKAWG